ncbi:2568_t:CDS:2, partial [Cetraspora pellucida]
VASTFKTPDGAIGFKSIIPQDTSSIVFSPVIVIPPYNPERNAPLQLSVVNA